MSPEQAAGRTHPAMTVIGTVVGGGALLGLLGALANALGGVSIPPLVGVSLIGVVFGISYLAARTAFRSFMRRRVRILTGLLDRLSRHITDTATPALPAGTPTEDDTAR